MEERRREENESLSTKRLEAFSDGVFAIAITLLILEIKIPDSSELGKTSLLHYLLGIWPKYFAYVFSFVVIGIYWANHHYIFQFYRKTNHVFNILNIFFLLTISFLPFPTAIFGEYINDAAHRRTAVIFYSIGIYLPAMAWICMWWYASAGKRLIDTRLSDTFIQYLNRLFALSNLLYLVCIALAFVSPRASVILNILLTLVYLLPPKKPEYS